MTTETILASEATENQTEEPKQALSLGRIEIENSTDSTPKWSFSIVIGD